MSLKITRQYVEALSLPPLGDTRITRQGVEVLHKGVGGVKITRQFFEVLYASSFVFTENMSDSLNITDDVNIDEYVLGLSDQLGITDSFNVQFPIRIEDTLLLQQQAGQTFEASLSDVITFSDHIIHVITGFEYAPFSDDLNLSQEIAFGSGLFNVMEDAMTMSDSVVAVRPIYLSPWTKLILKSYMPFEDKFEKLTDEMVVEHSAGREYSEDVTDAMSIIDVMDRVEDEGSILNMVQSLDWGKTKGIPIQLLNLTETVAIRGDWRRSVVDSLGVGHALTYYFESPCHTKNYTVFSGESTIVGQPEPPDEELPLVQGLPEDTRFLLLYPAAGESTDIVELRAPNLNNRERQAFTRINRETRGGRLTVFSDPTWPSVDTLVLSFSGLTKTEVEDTQAFLVSHIGLEVGLLDWEGRLWVGIITTPNEQAVQDGKENFTISFEFEGALLESNPSGSHMVVSDSLSYTGDWVRGPVNLIQFIQNYQMANLLNRTLSDPLNLIDEVSEILETP